MCVGLVSESCLTFWDITVLPPSPVAERCAVLRAIPAPLLVPAHGYSAGGLAGGSLVGEVGEGADGVVFGWVGGSEDHGHRKLG